MRSLSLSLLVLSMCLLSSGCPAWVPDALDPNSDVGQHIQVPGKVEWTVRHKPGISEIAWTVKVVNNSPAESSLLIIDCLNAKDQVRAEDDVVCRLAPGESATVVGVMDVPVTEIAGITQLVAFLVTVE